MGAQQYNVHYKINLYHEVEGTLVDEIVKEKILQSDTNDLRYLFTDIIDLHKGDNISGVQILNVSEAR